VLPNVAAVGWQAGWLKPEFLKCANCPRIRFHDECLVNNTDPPDGPRSSLARDIPGKTQACSEVPGEAFQRVSICLPAPIPFVRIEAGHETIDSLI